MAKAILVYSLGGTCLRLAGKISAETGADIIELKEAKRRTKANAFTSGVMQARGFKTVVLAVPIPNLTEYDDITLIFPIWAGCPAPAFNNAVGALPQGAAVTVFLVSAGGGTKEETLGTIRRKIEDAGCSMVQIKDVLSKEVE